MYENIIKNIETSLSSESKQFLYKKYNKLFYNINNNEVRKIKKVINTNLDNEINVISSTNHPEYDMIKKNNDDNDNDDKYLPEEKLVSTNMTLRDIEESKEEKINKKISAFTNFVSFKKNEKKNVLDYYKNTDVNETDESGETNIKSISFFKKK